ncbi:MAG: class I SAM-dependent methyltransferase [Calditrichaeota bacterium]|nr:MAG: class I SAM-dependent methyltransferase [Calditrichota bacterium]
MLYDNPVYYEAAFSFRDIKKESEFLQSCITTFSKREAKDVFEIACGHAPHAGHLTKSGYRYHGLDINRNMLDYAAYKWKDIEPKINLIEQDMVAFTYKQKVDFVFVMLGSLYINSMQEINSHFDSISNMLNPGGLYFLDWCIQFTDPTTLDENEFIVEKDGIEIGSKFNIRLLDSDNNLYEEIWTVNVNDKGRRQKFEMIERNRAILPAEFLNYINKRNDFEFVGWWSDWDLNKPIDEDEPPNRPIALIRKL